MKLSLVFPVYNEAGSIAQVLAQFSDYCTAKQIDHEIVVVNDGSRDATANQVQQFSNQHRSVQLIQHATNQGYGAALRSGFAAATGDFIFFTDSDGQFAPDDLESTLILADPNTIVLGYRKQRAEGALRRLNAGLWGRWIGRMLGFRVRDLNCAWKLFPRSLPANAQLTSSGAFINAELLAAARKYGLTFKEIPVRHFPRKSGSPTGANPRVILQAFQELGAFKRKTDLPTEP